MLPDVIKAALLEELRFAKRQQWTITAAVVALIAGAYGVAQPLALSDLEKVGATILVVVVVIAGIYWLVDLQRHLYRTRLRIDPYDPDPRWRGSEIVSGMAGAMILTAAVVCYLFCRDLISWRDLILGMCWIFIWPL
jgi:hypothetical protein